MIKLLITLINSLINTAIIKTLFERQEVLEMSVTEVEKNVQNKSACNVILKLVSGERWKAVKKNLNSS